MRVTRKFIAAKAGVSPTAVFDVLSKNPKARIGAAAREKIQKIADKYGYMPNMSAKSLVTGKTFNVGMILRCAITDFLKDPFTQEVFLGAESEIESNEYGLIFSLLKDEEEWNPSVKRILMGSSADGILLMGAVGDRLIDFLLKKSFPFVLIDFLVKGRKINTVLPENEKGAREAVEHLIGSGCRKIVCINGIHGNNQHQSYVERPAGYLRAMENAGLDHRIVETAPDIAGAQRTVEGLLLSGEEPDAFFATGDHMAIGCLRALKKVAPKSLAKTRIIGFDNISWLENETPKLSSVNVPKIQMGQEAARLLLKNMEEPGTAPSLFRLPTNLVIRET